MVHIAQGIVYISGGIYVLNSIFAEPTIMSHKLLSVDVRFLLHGPDYQ